MNGLIKDTSIVFELVLIGFQVLIWVSLLVLTVFGYQWLNLEALKAWSAQISIGLVGVAYMFGVIFDKAISSLPYRWVMGGSAPTETRDLPSPLEMRVEILTHRPEVSEILEKRINQHRLVRSTVINMTLISLSALAFFVTQIGFSIRPFVVFLFLSMLFVGLTLFTGRRSAETLYLELSQAHKAIRESSPAESGKKDRQSPTR
jgi:hypothetical protein